MLLPIQQPKTRFSDMFQETKYILCSHRLSHDAYVALNYEVLSDIGHRCWVIISHAY